MEFATYSCSRTLPQGLALTIISFHCTVWWQKLKGIIFGMRFGRVCVCPLLTLVVLCLVCEGSSTRAIHWVKTGARSKQSFLFQSRDLFRGEEVAGNKESQSRAVAAWVRKKENGNDDGEKPRKPQKGKSRKANKNSPRPPVFTARIAILGSPSEEWGQGVRERLISEGWMEERVQVLPIPSPQAYPEAKWMAYLREGLKLRNTTFVIAAPGPAVGQVLRFLEKHPLRGSILLGPEASSDTRSWDYKRLRQHCPFFGLIYAMEGEEEEWRPSATAEEVREGLGLAPYPFGIRATPPGQEIRAIQALIRDWQFLESLGMGPIQLVGEDEDEERERTGRDIPPMEEGNA